VADLVTQEKRGTAYGLYHGVISLALLPASVIAGWPTDALGYNTGGGESAAAEKELGKARSPHGSIAIACGNCHTSTSYKPIRPFPDFNHAETRYPLRGMHAGLDCRQCHANVHDRTLEVFQDFRCDSGGFQGYSGCMLCCGLEVLRACRFLLIRVFRELHRPHHFQICF
jgi:hypothetical protein